MLDLLPYIAEVLAPLGVRTELDYQDVGDTELPLLILSEVGNTSDVIYNGTEKLSGISIQIDVYALDVESVNKTAIDVSDAVIRAGFRRTYTQTGNDGELRRKVMQFEAAVDNARFIYAGNENI